MARMDGNQFYNPWKKERITTILATSVKQEGMLANKLIEEVWRKNRELGKKDPFSVCAIHRDRPVHRWFNLKTTLSAEVRPIYPDKDYAGAQELALRLLDGEWYIASPEEEAACKAKDEADREAALKLNTQQKLGEANAMIRGVMEAAGVQVQAQAQAQPKKKTPEEIKAEIARLQSELEPVSAGQTGDDKTNNKPRR